MTLYGSSFSFLSAGSANKTVLSGTVVDKLEAFSALRNGWSHGEGIPADPRAISAARSLIAVGTSMGLGCDVFPNIDGGCAVAFYEDTTRLEISVSPGGSSFDLRAERGIGFDYEEIFAPASVDSMILAALAIQSLFPRGSGWSSFASLIYGSSTVESSGFGTSSSAILIGDPATWKPLMAKAGSRSSGSSAPASTGQATACVAI